MQLNKFLLFFSGLFVMVSSLFSLSFPSFLETVDSLCFKSKNHSLWIEAIRGMDDRLFFKYLNEVDLNCRDDQGYTGLYYAVYYGRIDRLRLLLQRPVNLDLIFGLKGVTVLHKAILKFVCHPTDRSLFFDIIKVLVNSGASVHALNNDSMTPLNMLSSFVDAPFVLQFLLDHGAEVDCRDSLGWTPLMASVSRGFERNVICLIQNGADVSCCGHKQETALLQATCLNKTPFISTLLVERGANVNVKDKLGCTPLFFSVQKGWKDLVECLLLKGAIVNDFNSKKETPLIVAVREGYDCIVDKLIQFHADIHVTFEGKTLLMLASQKGFDSIVKTLILNGSLVNSSNIKKETALMYATYYGQFKTVRTLVQKGADINFKNREDWTALMMASYFGYLEIVCYLVQNGADMNLIGHSKKSQMLALKQHYLDVHSFLFRYQKMVDRQNSYVLFKKMSWEKSFEVLQFVVQFLKDQHMRGEVQIGLCSSQCFLLGYFKGTGCTLSYMSLNFDVHLGIDELGFSQGQSLGIASNNQNFLINWSQLKGFFELDGDEDSFLLSFLFSYRDNNVPLIDELREKFGEGQFELLSSRAEFDCKKVFLDYVSQQEGCDEEDLGDEIILRNVICCFDSCLTDCHLFS